LVAISTPVFEQVEKFRVGEIHGRPTRSKICVGHGPHGPHGSGAYGICDTCCRLTCTSIHLAFAVWFQCL